MNNKFIIEKWVNSRHFFIDEKHLQKLSLRGQIISAYLYYMIILYFSQFIILQLVKQWLAVVNSVLIVVLFETTLTTVKQCLTIFFFPKTMCYWDDLYQMKQKQAKKYLKSRNTKNSND